jgi:hypothetical protein
MPKLGLITASQAGKIMATGRGKDNPFGATFYGYARQVAAGRLGYDVSTDISHMSAVQWGIENEWLAVEAYREETFADVQYTGDDQRFTVHPEYDFLGCTPDGLVGSDGLIEIKCPNSDNHFANLCDNAQLDDYIPQMQFQMLVTGRKWCDWISFDPRAPEALQLHVVRVMRDDAYIATLLERAIELNRIADEIADGIRERIGMTETNNKMEI